MSDGQRGARDANHAQQRSTRSSARRGISLARSGVPCIYMLHADPPWRCRDHGRRLPLLPRAPGLPRHHPPVRRSAAAARHPCYPADPAQCHRAVRRRRGRDGAARGGARHGCDDPLAEPPPPRQGQAGAAVAPTRGCPDPAREAHSRRRATHRGGAAPLDGRPSARSLHARQRHGGRAAGPPRRGCPGGRHFLPGHGAIR